LLPIATFGQDLASIVGTVTDPSDAAVPDAKITITSQTTGVSRAAVTNPTGSYSVPALPIGTYSLRAERAGFQAYVQSGIVLNVRDIVRVDIQLKLGQVTQEVTVQAAATAVKLQTESGEVNELISGRQVSEISINGRNFLQLATLVTGASSQLPSFNVPVGVSANASIAFNGERASHNIWFVDGQENYDRGCGGCITVLPSQDAIQEFKVQASNMAADTGFGTGGQIQVEIKGGTRDFHGTAYEFLRNDALDATSYFANLSGTSKPPLKFNNFGYNFGGPFYIPGHYNTDKSKTFFFWSQEWRKLRQGTTIYAAAAPADWRTGILTSYDQPILDHTKPVTLPDGTTGYQPFTDNIIPQSMLDPNALILAAPNFILPTPNTADGKFYAASPSVPTDVREEILRVDHQISEKTSLMFRYIHDAVNQTFPTTMWSGSTYPTIGTQFINPPRNLVLKLTRSINPTLLNEFMVAFQRQPLILNPTGIYQRPSNLAVPELFPDNRDNRIPTIGLYGPALGVNYDPSSWPWYNVSNTWTWRDQVSKSHGNHTLRIGFQYMRFLKEQDLFGPTQGSFTFDGSATAGKYLGTDGQIHSADGNEFADFLLGEAKSYNEMRLQTRPAYIVNNFGFWFADTWKVRTGFTLDYGLRWEGMPHAYEIHNNVASFRPSLYDPSKAPQLYPNGQIVPDTGDLLNGMAIAGQSGIPRGLVENHWALFQPRLGFAWKPFGAEKTVVRAGYGMFFERVQGNDIYNVGPNPPFSGSAQIFNTLLSNPGVVPGAIFPPSTQNYDPNYLQPYAQQYSFGIQREINPQTILSVMYVGSKGTHLQINRNINQPLAPAGDQSVNTVRPYKGYGDLNWYENSTSSSYNSLQVSLRTSNWHGLSSGVAYTWSHSIDFASDDVPGITQNAYDVRAERGHSAFDRRHMLVINYVYDLPIFRNATGAVKTLLGGWELSGITAFQTGLPVTVTFPGDPAQVGSAPYRANLIGDPNSGPGVHTREMWFNPAAFGPVPTGSFGNAARNVVFGQGINNWDISVFKNFSGIPFPRSKEGANVQFRAEFFNAWNHAQFNGYFTSFGAAGFGGANSTRDPRIIQFGLKFLF
jgi:hypothetical protein